MSIGTGAHIERAIIDKNCHIGNGVRIENAQGLQTSEETDYGMIRDGVFVATKGATLPDGWSV
jgi:glucose-1-phosphate adenylyltransferase